jgi:hypothetical protein
MSEQTPAATAWRTRAGRRELTLPSGQVVEFRPPRVEVFLKHGRFPYQLARKLQDVEGQDELSDDEKGAVLFASLTPDEQKQFSIYADDVVIGSVVSPKISRNPKSDEEIHVEDVPRGDYWTLFTASTRGIGSQPIETKDGETTVEAVETFRDESGVRTDGADGANLRPAGEPVAGREG